MEHHLTATGCHLPYGITQCYLPPDTSEHIPPSPRPVWPVLDLPTPRFQRCCPLSMELTPFWHSCLFFITYILSVLKTHCFEQAFTSP